MYLPFRVLHVHQAAAYVLYYDFCMSVRLIHKLRQLRALLATVSTHSYQSLHADMLPLRVPCCSCLQQP